MTSRFAVLNEEGELENVHNSVHSAVQAASRIAPRVQVEGGDESHLNGFGEFGAIDPAQYPERALLMSGLPRLDLDKVMKMSLEEAHRRVYPFFPGTRTRKSGEKVPVKNYNKISGMVKALLGQNYKTAKETPEAPTNVQGLSLLPYSEGQQNSLRSLPMRGLGFCAGSSKACQTACLVNSGHNVIDVYNKVVKTAKTEALSLEPIAFGRLLVESLRKHFEPRSKRAKSRVAGYSSWEDEYDADAEDEDFAEYGEKKFYEPLVRLNVFSDIPWELVFPGVFERFSGGQFYDYTKVPGRVTPPNYDLTFSWSGSNRQYVNYEMERGRRIAVVFLPVDRKIYNRWRKTKDKRSVAMMGLPARFLNRPVVDGDISDVRPRDPGDCIVGLRWKPHGLGKKHGAKPEEIKAFVVPFEETDGVLVAPMSSRATPIVDADEEIE